MSIVHDLTTTTDRLASRHPSTIGVTYADDTSPAPKSFTETAFRDTTRDSTGHVLQFPVQPNVAKAEPFEIYPDISLNPHLAAVPRMMETATARIEAACTRFEEGDRMQALIEIQLLETVLMEMFCCRQVGEGFSAVVVALRNASLHLHGEEALTIDHFYAMRGAMRSLASDPTLSENAAIDIAMELEDAGLRVETGLVESFVALMNGESTS
jgi:hypothetical protein